MAGTTESRVLKQEKANADDQSRPFSLSPRKPMASRYISTDLSARRWRFDVNDLPEIALQHGQQIGLRTALEGLGEKMSARRQHVDGKPGGDFAQMHGSQMVRLPVACGRRGQVRQHHVGYSTASLFQLFGSALVEEIHLQETHARNQVHFQEIDRGDTRILVGRPRHRGGDLGPASRRRSEIDDPFRAFQDGVFPVDLEQLECGPGTIAFQFGALDVGVIDVALQPAADDAFILPLFLTFWPSFLPVRLPVVERITPASIRRRASAYAPACKMACR